MEKRTAGISNNHRGRKRPPYMETKMQIRIYDTDFEGNPVECTGDRFSGKTALDIVTAMGMNPFNANLEPMEFMRQILDRIGQKDFPLPDDAESAAGQFLQRLTVCGYAEFELADGDTTNMPAIAKPEGK